MQNLSVNDDGNVDPDEMEGASMLEEYLQQSTASDEYAVTWEDS